MILSNLHLKFERKQIQDGGSLTVRTFKERFLRFQLLFPDFYHFRHVIWGMKWAKKLKTKNGQNMSSGPFSHDVAHLIIYQGHSSMWTKLEAKINPIRYDLHQSCMVHISLTYQTTRREIASCVYNSRELHHATLTSSFCCLYASIFQFHRFPAFNRRLCSSKHSTEESDRQSILHETSTKDSQKALVFTSSCELVV